MEKSFAANILHRFLGFRSENFLKKNRFFISAITLSILLHVLIFVFAPELKSEINSNSYLKKITRISIFRDDSNSAPNRNIEISKSRNIDKTTGAPDRNLEISKSRNIDKATGAPDRNLEISKSRNIDKATGAPDRNLEISKSRNIDETAGAPDRNLETSKSRNIDKTAGAPDRDAVTPGRRDDKTTGAPKTAGELAVIPKALNPQTPDYPESLEDEGVEGTVTLELLISKEGKVLKAKVIKSDHELFSESALKAVKKYKFSPGKLADGSSADSIIEFVVKFEISL